MDFPSDDKSLSAQVLELPSQPKHERYEPVLDTKGNRLPGLLRYRATQEIWIRKSFKKRRIPTLFVNTHEVTLGRAKTKAEMLIQQHLNEYLGIQDEHVFGRAIARPLRDIIDWVLENHTPLQRKRTQRKHQDYFKLIDERLGARDINSITGDIVKAWVEEMRAGGKRSTFSDFTKHLNLLMRHAYQKKWATHLIRFSNPDARPDDDETPQANWRVYTADEIKALWNAMADDLQDQFVLSYECFMRKREVLYLTKNRLDLQTGRIVLRPQDVKTGSKTGKGRDFIISEHALRRMRARIARSNPLSPYVFPSRVDYMKPAEENRRAWESAKVAAGITGKATWHSLRHTALTIALLVERRNPTAISEYAGVSLQTIQRVYLHSKAEDTKDIAGSVRVNLNAEGGEL